MGVGLPTRPGGIVARTAREQYRVKVMRQTGEDMIVFDSGAALPAQRQMMSLAR